MHEAIHVQQQTNKSLKLPLMRGLKSLKCNRRPLQSPRDSLPSPAIIATCAPNQNDHATQALCWMQESSGYEEGTPSSIYPNTHATCQRFIRYVNFSICEKFVSLKISMASRVQQTLTSVLSDQLQVM